MILIDTNVISEPLRSAPEPRVAQWLDRQDLETLFLFAITVAELRFGVYALPVGRRRDRLNGDLESQILPMFAGRILSFNLAASQAYAELMAKARSTGLAISVLDGCIAATAASKRMAVATRDSSPFQAAGLETINPWVF